MGVVCQWGFLWVCEICGKGVRLNPLFVCVIMGAIKQAVSGRFTDSRAMGKRGAYLPRDII